MTFISPHDVHARARSRVRATWFRVGFRRDPKKGQKRGVFGGTLKRVDFGLLQKSGKKVSRMGELLNTHENVHFCAPGVFPRILFIQYIYGPRNPPGPPRAEKPEKPGVAISRPAGTPEIGVPGRGRKRGFLGGFWGFPGEGSFWGFLGGSRGSLHDVTSTSRRGGVAWDVSDMSRVARGERLRRYASRVVHDVVMRCMSS